MSLKGKTAVITGSGRGIGKAIAFKLAQMGANVVLNSTPSSDSADIAAEELRAAGYNVIVTKGNVSCAEDVEVMINTAKEAFGSVDILVNNAGITRDTLLVRMSEEDWDDVLDTNLKGAFLCTKAAAKIMVKQRSGKIINITSVAGVMGNPGQANYSASKAGMIGLTKTTAKELASRGITCNAVAPGLTISRMTEALPEKVKENYLSNIPLGRFGTPEDVANVVGFLASDDANYITGQVIHIDGGLVM
ncbi:beta-ketoacyl-ACP reductase [Clostridium thermosuccinogenes]|jgi:3-oxoacyl-[acyl-carrier protein] reductase|uniref:3-oxoacyl-[acyl-carrier-protein] reductase n=1 Tax=Clostridium thermosuccinogenes TaxID=84032 RepID=A0A2K2FG71_9CLOT|nr:3-oxoacyl-[acyl-carrier-protein] reductase [Pseudoclostridium thermosuccinogenes]AUS96457.1 beta-ketoacyl-ACP reductase [Pseudoclostridium thermosuccinogenes]PNT97771.1 beta-ketoacyl-ACP reductase [Pseudoclostridium thermosuccinogenes]PNT99761.1 beta-ketoacyl-ACP reductase [Pseudoclostridium thermosuccinogenes]